LTENGFENRRRGHAKTTLSLDTCCKIEGFGCSRNVMKIIAKMDAEIYQNPSKIKLFGAHGLHFEFFGGTEIDCRICYLAEVEKT